MELVALVSVSHTLRGLPSTAGSNPQAPPGFLPTPQKHGCIDLDRILYIVLSVQSLWKIRTALCSHSFIKFLVELTIAEITVGIQKVFITSASRVDVLLYGGNTLVHMMNLIKAFLHTSVQRGTLLTYEEHGIISFNTRTKDFIF